MGLVKDFLADIEDANRAARAKLPPTPTPFDALSYGEVSGGAAPFASATVPKLTPPAQWEVFNTNNWRIGRTPKQIARIERRLKREAEALFQKTWKTAPWTLEGGDELAFDTPTIPEGPVELPKGWKHTYEDVPVPGGTREKSLDLIFNQEGKAVEGEIVTPWQHAYTAEEGFEELSALGIRDVSELPRPLVGKGRAIGREVSRVWTNTRLGFARLPLSHKALTIAGIGAMGYLGYNLFSGKDDNYNTIEGMSELGLAAQQRKILTDFGSGYQGQQEESGSGWLSKGLVLGGAVLAAAGTGAYFLSRRSAAAAATGVAEKVAEKAAGSFGEYLGEKNFSQQWIRDLAAKASRDSTNSFIEKIGVHRLDNPYLNFQGGMSVAPKPVWEALGIDNWADLVELAPYVEGLSFGSAAVSARGPVRSIKDALHATANLPQSAGGASGEIRQKAHLLSKRLSNILNTSPETESAINKIFAFHERAEVHVGEAIDPKYYVQLTEKYLPKSIQFQHNTILPQEELFARSLGNREAYEVFAELRQITDPWYKGFSGWDDAHNTIEGLRHGGLAEELRKILTDFGSGWRGAIVSGAISMGKEFASTLKQYKGTAIAGLAVGLYYGWQKGKEEGRIRWGQFAGLLAADMADDVLLLGSIQAAKKFPALEKVRPYLEHPIVKRAGMGLFGFTIGKLAGEIGANLFIPKENAGYNPIEGMHPGDGGEATRIIRENTPFGTKINRSKVFANWLIGGTIEETAAAGKAGIFQRLTAFLRQEDIRMVSPATAKGGWIEKIREAKAGTWLGRDVSPQNKELARMGVLIGIDKPAAASMVERTMRRTLTDIEKAKLVPPLVGIHEGGEAVQLIRLARQQGLRTWGPREKLENAKSMMVSLMNQRRVSTHQGFLPIFNEMYGSALHSREMFEMTKAYRLAELERSAEMALRSEIPAEIKNAAMYIGKTKKIIANVERKLLPRIERARLMHIEGMPSGGMAHEMRDPNFKSPWGRFTRAFGSLFPKKAAPEVVSFMGAKTGAKGLLSPTRAAELAKGETLEGFAEKLRTELQGQGVDIWTFRGAEGTAQFKGITKELGEKHGWDLSRSGAFATGEAGQRTVLMNVETLRESFQNVAQRAGVSSKIAGKAIESEDFLKTVLYHEVLESQSHNLMKLGTKLPGASHASSQVLLGEGAFIQQLGNKHVGELFWKIRKGTSAIYKGGGWEGKAFEYGYAAAEGGRRAKHLTKLMETFETSSAKETLAATAPELRSAQQQLSRAAVAGGKGHLHPSGKHVKQLSRYGGEQ